jgi:uncharacterized protein (DUF427 family)
MSQPNNADHPIRIVANGKRLRVLWKGKVVAESARALNLFEASYPGVRYIPREDALMTLLERSTHETQCPYKGKASYYSLVAPDGRVENAVWTYESPFPVAEKIAGYLAFDPRHVEFKEEAPGAF